MHYLLSDPHPSPFYRQMIAAGELNASIDNATGTVAFIEVRPCNIRVRMYVCVSIESRAG